MNCRAFGRGFFFRPPVSDQALAWSTVLLSIPAGVADTTCAAGALGER